MRTRYKADYYMSSTPNVIKDLTNKIKVILNESRTYRNRGYICCNAKWITISAKAHYDKNNHPFSFEFKLFGSERIDPADGCTVDLEWTEFDELKLDDKQKAEYLKKCGEINKKLYDFKNQEWQQIINNEYNRCRRRYRATSDILEELDRRKLQVNIVVVIEKLLNDLFDAFGDMDPVTTRRMSDYFEKPTSALLLGRYIYCKTSDHGYIILDSEYMLSNLSSPVVYCTNDLYQNTQNINNTKWFNELIEQSNIAYEYLHRCNTVESQPQKEKKSK